jgi:hypothetical protein
MLIDGALDRSKTYIYPQEKASMHAYVRILTAQTRPLIPLAKEKV